MAKDVLITPDLLDVLKRGYFPKELPHRFTTFEFAKWVEQHNNLAPFIEDCCKESKFSDYVRFTYPKHQGFRRTLAVANPLFHLRLAKCLTDNWEYLERPLNKSPLSLSKPKIVKAANGRYFQPTEAFADLYIHKVRFAATARFVLYADISNFYSSIYSHAVAWSMEGKSVSKRKVFNREKLSKPKNKLAGNLDKYICDLQNKESVGLLVGPDTSFVLAELVGSRLDRLFRYGLKREKIDCKGYRYFDDMAFYFRSERDANRAYKILRELLSQHHLVLNEEKTYVRRLPGGLKSSWTYQFASFRFDSGNLPRDFNHYFSTAFELQEQHPREGVLSYALARFARDAAARKVPIRYWPTLLALLTQMMLTRPETIERVHALLSYYSRPEAPEYDSWEILEEAVNELILGSSPEDDYELAWALTFARDFKLRLTPEATAQVSKSTNPITVICALELVDTGGVAPEEFDTSLWTKILDRKDRALYGDNWILVYECCLKGWLGTDRTLLTDDPFFKELSDAGISFFHSAGFEPENVAEDEEDQLSGIFTTQTY